MYSMSTHTTPGIEVHQPWCVAETSELTGEEYAPNDVDYEDVVQGLQDEEMKVYIDVREFDEVEETGQIPTSRVVPRKLRFPLPALSHVS